jgi:hypothetical protein
MKPDTGIKGQWWETLPTPLLGREPGNRRIP